MNGVFAKMIEKVMATHWKIRKMVLHLFPGDGDFEKVYIYNYPTYRVALVIQNDLVCYDNWLPSNTNVPLICVHKEGPLPDHFTPKESEVKKVEDRRGGTTGAYDRGWYVISVNNAFFKQLSMLSQTAMIEHEMIHILQGNVDTQIDDSIDIGKEILADVAVVQKGQGEALLQALTVSLDTIPEVPWRARARKIIEFRIDFIVKYVMIKYKSQCAAQAALKEFMSKI